MLCSIFENPVIVHKDNQGAIRILVAAQMRPHTKHIVIFQCFIANGDVEIQHIDTKKQIADIFMKTLESEFEIYLR